jgi:hypothetical protein
MLFLVCCNELMHSPKSDTEAGRGYPPLQGNVPLRRGIFSGEQVAPELMKHVLFLPPARMQLQLF